MSEKHPHGIFTRREALKLGLLGAAGLALGDPLSLAVQPVATRPRAKSVIQIWMWGGPSHLDTFDPKPDAGYDYCGPLDKPIATNVDGMRIGQLLPLLAQQADKYSIIRSMTHGVNAHETASYIVQTGHDPGRLVYPSAGAVVSLLKGYDHGYQGLVPPYVVLTQPQGDCQRRVSWARNINRSAPVATPTCNPSPSKVSSPKASAISVRKAAASCCMRSIHSARPCPAVSRLRNSTAVRKMLTR